MFAAAAALPPKPDLIKRLTVAFPSRSQGATERSAREQANREFPAATVSG